jgi:hypothetical protein
MMTDACIVLTTAGSSQEAEKIAAGLVERRLAACVNIIPQIQSVYRWDGKVSAQPSGCWSSKHGPKPLNGCAMPSTSFIPIKSQNASC